MGATGGNENTWLGGTNSAEKLSARDTLSHLVIFSYFSPHENTKISYFFLIDSAFVGCSNIYQDVKG
jgi:hypothetical protein